MKIILYSTHCPQCNVLTDLLNAKNLEFELNDNIEEMKKLKFKSSPMLQVDDKIMNFKEAYQWAKGYNV